MMYAIIGIVIGIMEIKIIAEIVAYLAFWHVLVWFIQWIDYKKDVKKRGKYYADQIRRYM